MSIAEIEAPTQTDRSVHQFELLQPDQFFTHLVGNISAAKAGDPVYIQSMRFHATPQTEDLVEECVEAKKRGADVRMVLDAMAKVETLFYYNWKKIPENERERASEGRIKKQELLNRLSQAGITVVYTNEEREHKIAPEWGRNHNKTFIVGKRAYITDILLQEGAIDLASIALHTQLPEIVDAYKNQFLIDFEKKPRRQNERIPCGDNYELLIDQGKLGSSLIQSNAIAMLNQAPLEDEVLFTSQLTPFLPISWEIFKRAHRGIREGNGGGRGRILISSEDDNLISGNPVYRGILNLCKHGLRRTNEAVEMRYYPGKVHEKLFMVGDEGIIGSHNLHPAGIYVYGGTVETDLRFRDAELAEQLREDFNGKWEDSTPVEL